MSVYPLCLANSLIVGDTLTNINMLYSPGPPYIEFYFIYLIFYFIYLPISQFICYVTFIYNFVVCNILTMAIHMFLGYLTIIYCWSHIFQYHKKKNSTLLFITILLPVIIDNNSSIRILRQ